MSTEAEAGKIQEEADKELHRRIVRESRTSFVVNSTEDQDSLEIGMQASGRVKIYGKFEGSTFSQKIASAAKAIREARAALQASQEQTE